MAAMFNQPRRVPLERGSIPVEDIPCELRPPGPLAETIPARLGEWAASHGIKLGEPLTDNLRAAVERALGEYFHLAELGAARVVSGLLYPGGRVAALIIPGLRQPWTAVCNDQKSTSELEPALLRRMVEGAWETRLHEAAPAKNLAYLAKNGWKPGPDDLSPGDLMHSALPGRSWPEILAIYFRAMRQGPPQKIRLAFDQLLELAPLFDDLPALHARAAMEQLADQCDPALRDLVIEDPGVRVREYNFALETPDAAARVNRFRWARSFPAYWGLRREFRIQPLIDSGQPVIKPIAALLDCSTGAVRRLRTMEHAAVMLHPEEGRYLDEEGWCVDEEAEPDWPRAEADPDPRAVDIPRLLLAGLAGLPLDKIPPCESLRQLGIVFEAGVGRHAPVPAVLCASFYTAVLLMGEPPAAVDAVIPAFRLMLAATGGDWEGVGRQIHDISAAQVTGICDFVSALAAALVLPQLLRSAEDRGQEDVQTALVRKARVQTALLLASRWHIGQFLRHSAEWHKSLGVDPNEGLPGSCRFLTWPAWFKPVKANGLLIEPLCSSAALREEGARMHHCVGGYDIECASGQTQIFSVRTLGGQRLSTLQLTVQVSRGGKDKCRFSEAQHLAAHNQPPPAKAMAAVKRLLAALNRGELPHQAAEALKDPVLAGLNTICGFDFSDDAAWSEAGAGLAPFLPSDLQGLGAAECAARFTAYKPPARSEQPELAEDDADDEDFELRVLRWIR